MIKFSLMLGFSLRNSKKFHLWLISGEIVLNFKLVLPRRMIQVTIMCLELFIQYSEFWPWEIIRHDLVIKVVILGHLFAEFLSSPCWASSMKLKQTVRHQNVRFHLGTSGIILFGGNDIKWHRWHFYLFTFSKVEPLHKLCLAYGKGLSSL